MKGSRKLKLSFHFMPWGFSKITHELDILVGYDSLGHTLQPNDFIKIESSNSKRISNL